MRTLVIGGSRGLGAALVDQFGVGYANTVKYTGSELDISNPESRKILVDYVEEYDVVINNAYCGSGQRDLMLEIFDRYKDTNKVLVNIESMNAWRQGPLNSNQIMYATDKLALVEARRHLQRLPRSLKIIGICPAMIDTEYNKNKPGPKMSAVDVALIVFNVVQYTRSGIEVLEIHLQRNWDGDQELS